MVLEGIDYIFYTTREGHNILIDVLEQVSKKWTEMEGFVSRSDTSIDSNFEVLPDKDTLIGSWIGVYIFKDKQTREKSRELGCGVDENIDKNTFDIFYSQKDYAKLSVIVNKRNEAFAIDTLPEISFQVDPYEAIVACPKLFEITLTVSEEPKNDTIVAWLFSLVEEACLGNILTKSKT